MTALEPVSFAPFAFAGAQAQPFEFGFNRDDDRGAIAKRLRHQLDALFRHLHGHGHGARRARATERAAESLSPLVDQAAQITAGSFRLQIASISIDSAGNVSARSLVIEAQLFRLEAATPHGSAIIDFAGAKVSLASAEVDADGDVQATGRSLELSAFNLFADADGQTLAAQQAIATLIETRVALAAYRAGDTGPLARLIDDA